MFFVTNLADEIFHEWFYQDVMLKALTSRAPKIADLKQKKFLLANTFLMHIMLERFWGFLKVWSTGVEQERHIRSVYHVLNF